MKLFFFTACIFVCCKLQAQQSTLENLLGVWKGTSLCQVKNSPCHDETNVYYITKGNSDDSCSIRANKIVNGKEEEMGTLPCRIDKENNEIISSSHNAKWTFKLKGEKLEGTLVYQNSLYRVIELSKVK